MTASPLNDLIMHAAAIWGTTSGLIKGSRRDRNISEARHAVFYIAIKHLLLRPDAIAEHMSRDRTTVTEMAKQIERRAVDDPSLRFRLDQLTASQRISPVDYNKAVDQLGDWLARGLANIRDKNPQRFKQLVSELNEAAE